MYGRLMHYVGTIKDGDTDLTIVWRWNRYSQCRVYEVSKTDIFEEMVSRYAKDIKTK